MIRLNTYRFRPKIIISRQRNEEQFCYSKISNNTFKADQTIMCNFAPECPFKTHEFSEGNVSASGLKLGDNVRRLESIFSARCYA